MRASELIEVLEGMVREHGDLNVVSGVARSGYGEAVIDADLVEGPGVTGCWIDLILSEESCVSVIPPLST